MKKRLLIGVLMLTMAGMTAGCGSSQTTATTEPETEAEEVTEAEETEEVEETEDADAAEEEAEAGDGSLARIQEAGVIKVGTEGTYEPFTYYDDTNTLVGYDVEIARAVAEKLGVEVEFVETSWDGIIAGLDAKRSDAVFNQVTITDEREAKYNFSQPYTYAHGALIVASDNDEIQKFEDLQGKTVAASITSDWATMAEGFGGSIASTTQFTESVTLVETGRADAVLNDELVFYDYVNTTGDDKVKIADLTEDVNRNAVLVRKEDKDLVEAIDAALTELREEGVLTSISNKYFGTDLSQE